MEASEVRDGLVGLISQSLNQLTSGDPPGAVDIQITIRDDQGDPVQPSVYRWLELITELMPVGALRDQLYRSGVPIDEALAMDLANLIVAGPVKEIARVIRYAWGDNASQANL